MVSSPPSTSFLHQLVYLPDLHFELNSRLLVLCSVLMRLQIALQYIQWGIVLCTMKVNCSHLAAQTTHSVSCCREFLDGWLLRTLRDPNCYTLLDFKAIRLATQWFGPCRSMLMVRHIKSKWKSVAKSLSMSFPVKSSSHCWVTSSDSLMHELKLSM